MNSELCLSKIIRLKRQKKKKSSRQNNQITFSGRKLNHYQTSQEQHMKKASTREALSRIFFLSASQIFYNPFKISFMATEKRVLNKQVLREKWTLEPLLMKELEY